MAYTQPSFEQWLDEFHQLLSLNTLPLNPIGADPHLLYAANYKPDQAVDKYNPFHAYRPANRTEVDAIKKRWLDDEDRFWWDTFHYQGMIEHKEELMTFQAKFIRDYMPNVKNGNWDQVVAETPDSQVRNLFTYLSRQRANLRITLNDINQNKAISAFGKALMLPAMEQAYGIITKTVSEFKQAIERRYGTQTTTGSQTRTASPEEQGSQSTDCGDQQSEKENRTQAQTQS